MPLKKKPMNRRSSADWGAPGRKRSRYLDGVKEIRYDDYELLRKFTTEHGKIMPSRLTGTTPKQQRQLARAIRRARVMGILR